MAINDNFFSQWLAAWSGNKPDELLAFYDQEIFYSDPAHKHGIQGKELFKNYLIKLLAKNPEWKWEAVHLDQVTPTRYYLKWKATIPTATKIVIEYGLDLIELKNEKIIRNEVYFDTRLL
jgi:hypothetical protein